MANTRIPERAAPRIPNNHGSPTNWGIFGVILAAAVLVAVVLIALFPNLRGNPGELALVLLTPLLAGLSVALTRSGLRRDLPQSAAWGVRGVLALVVVLDLLVFALPMFVSGPTAHDATPTFAGTTATQQPAAKPPAATSAPTSAPTTAPAPAAPRTGAFDARAGGDSVSGTAILGKTTDGQSVLRLQNLQATNGPDLYVYLAKDASPATSAQVMSGYEVGTLRATSGDSNYTLPASVDPSQYQSVVIYCKSFSVVFGFANLK